MKKERPENIYIKALGDKIPREHRIPVERKKAGILRGVIKGILEGQTSFRLTPNMIPDGHDQADLSAIASGLLGPQRSEALEELQRYCRDEKGKLDNDFYYGIITPQQYERAIRPNMRIQMCIMAELEPERFNRLVISHRKKQLRMVS